VFSETKYQPLERQKKFHESTERFECIEGGMGSGKTHALVMDAYKFARGFPDAKVYVFAPFYEMIDYLLAVWRNQIPERLYKVSLVHLTISLNNGAIIAFRPFDPEKLRGLRFDAIYIDASGRGLTGAMLKFIYRQLSRGVTVRVAL
jgi:hypothetical protein